MNIARFSVTRPVAVTMRIAGLVLLGAVCFTKLPVDLLPAVSLPTVAVITQWPNVAPEEMETQITRPIEEAVASTPNVYQVSSSTVEGSSTVRVQLNWGADVGQGAVDVLQLVERARQRFPNDPTLQTPIVFKYDPSQLPIIIFAVSGMDDQVKLRTILDNEITPMLESANGVASAVATGGLQRAIIVDVDPVKLQAYHIALPQISRRIIQENVDLPAGIAKQSDTEYTIRSFGYFQAPSEIAQIPVGSFNGQLIALGQVATVKDSYQEQRMYTRMNGSPAAGMVIVKQSGANTVATADNVFEKLKTVQKLYPNLKFNLAYNQAEYISASVDDVKMSAIIGGTLAVIILLFFLRSVRSTLVVALSIPFSIISTFALLYFCGFTLNTMSLSGLSLATGLIVDDAVVVLENIFRHIQRDKLRAAEAAVVGTTEIGSAVFASTITIMVVFLPLLLVKGQSGQLFTQLALVVIFSIAVSLLDAMTVVPMLASRIIKEEDVLAEADPEHVPEKYRRGALNKMFIWFGKRFEALDHSYRHGLEWAIHHRMMVVGGALAITAAAFLLVPYIGTEMMPQTDSGNFNVVVKLPVGTAIDKTNQTMKQVEQMVMSNPNVETAFSAAGTTLSLRGSTTQLKPEQGSVMVRLKDERTQSTQQVMQQLQKQLGGLPGVRAVVTPYDLVTLILTGGAQNIEADIYGSNLQTLGQLADSVLPEARTIPGFMGVDTNVQDATPELRFTVDRQKALQLGVSFTDIATAIDTATNGYLSSYYQENGYQYPIYVQLPEAQRKTVDELLRLPISPTTGVGNGPTGAQVTLGQVAKAKPTFGPNEITRQNNQRYIAITGLAQGRPESEVTAELGKIMDRLQLPQGYYWEWGVRQQRRDEEFGGLGLAVFLAIALIYMLLAAQFESFIHPLTVLVCVPLSIIGVALALFLTGRAFGLTAFIGLLMLVGIVVKNGILLVDYTNQLRGRGMPRDQAILTASPTRLRPILMTTCAASLGMLPLALGIGKGSETQAPLATAVIGGLLTSTMLTLFVVPTVYTLFDDLGRRFRKDKLDLGRPELVPPSVEAFEREPASVDGEAPRPAPEPVD